MFEWLNKSSGQLLCAVLMKRILHQESDERSSARNLSFHVQLWKRGIWSVVVSFFFVSSAKSWNENFFATCHSRTFIAWEMIKYRTDHRALSCSKWDPRNLSWTPADTAAGAVVWEVSCDQTSLAMFVPTSRSSPPQPLTPDRPETRVTPLLNASACSAWQQISKVMDAVCTAMTVSSGSPGSGTVVEMGCGHSSLGTFCPQVYPCSPETNSMQGWMCLRRPIHLRPFGSFQYSVLFGVVNCYPRQGREFTFSLALLVSLDDNSQIKSHFGVELGDLSSTN